MDIQELDDVRMIPEFFQEYNLPEGSLGVCSVPEGIEYLLDRHHGPSPPVCGLPHHSVGSLPQASSDLVFLPDMRVNIRGGLIVGHLERS